MARWKLTANHYLNVEGWEWEQNETSVETGRQVRKRYKVPRFLDINDPADWNNYTVFDRTGKPAGGEITVSDGNGASPRDIVFEGPPTPDMLPLDDDAQRISDGFKEHWTTPTEATQGDFAQTLIEKMTKQMDRIASGQLTSVGSVSKEAFDQLQGQVSALMEQNAKLMATLAEGRARRP